VLLLGFAQARADWGPLQREVGSSLHRSSVLVTTPSACTSHALVHVLFP
jgi:hypothetical protein